MRRSIALCLVPVAVAGCALVDLVGLHPGHGSMTGDWEGYCCDFPNDILDAGEDRYYLQLTEGADGRLTGTVTRKAYRFFLWGPESVSSGTVEGLRDGTKVVLYYSYADLGRVRHAGRQRSRDRFQYRDYEGYQARFERAAPELSLLTGRWRGDCCFDVDGTGSPGYQWTLDMIEDAAGRLSGSLWVRSGLPGHGSPVEAHGDISGTRSGEEIELVLSYADGPLRGTHTRIEARRLYPHGFQGFRDGNPEYMAWFERSPDDPLQSAATPALPHRALR